MTKIQWTDTIWSPLARGHLKDYPPRLADPLAWKTPRWVHINPTNGDLFCEDVPFSFIAAVYGVMAACPQHQFQILTRDEERAAKFYEWAGDGAHEGNVIEEIAFGLPRYDAHRAAELLGGTWEPPQVDGEGRVELAGYFDGITMPWPPPNVWLGVSIEDQATAEKRIPHLLQCRAAVRFVSYEPALGLVDFRPWLRPLRTWGRRSDGAWGCGSCCNGDRCDDPSHVDRRFCSACKGTGAIPFTAIDWVIVGGESGPGARPCDLAWIRAVRDQCRIAGVPLFIKQLGARPYDLGGDHLCPDGSPPVGCYLDLQDPAGSDPSEWPADLRVREMP